MTDVNVEELIALTRIAVSDEEKEALKKEIPAILGFVDQIQEAGGSVEKHVGDIHNVLREDADPHESGAYTKEILEAMPRTKDGYLAVKKIIQKK